MRASDLTARRERLAGPGSGVSDSEEAAADDV